MALNLDSLKNAYNQIKTMGVKGYKRAHREMRKTFKRFATEEAGVRQPLTRGQFYSKGCEEIIPTINALGYSVLNAVKIVCTLGRNQHCKDRFIANALDLYTKVVFNTVVVAGVIMPERTNLSLNIVRPAPAPTPTQP